MGRAKLTIVGFKDEASLLWGVAERLLGEAFIARESTYPAGELALRVPSKVSSRAVVAMNIREEPLSLFRALILSAGLRASGAKRVDLVAPWIAYGRQDRSNEPGETPAGQAVASALAGAFERIVTLDAHSPVFEKAFRGRLVNVLPAFERASWRKEITAVAAPDAGAHPRARAVATSLKIPCVRIEKNRQGIRVTCRISEGIEALRGARVMLVDDMADSGGTLRCAAETLYKAGAESVLAYVTHAMDLAKLRRKLEPDRIRVECAFDHARGTLDPHQMEKLLLAL